MAIKTVSVSNFKSFSELKVELGKFNVLIGANASGKSNFIQIFRFLRDTIDYGLNNAIAMQGGIEYCRNMSIGSSADSSLEIVLAKQFRISIPKGPRLIGLRIYETTYRVLMEFKKKGRGLRGVGDQLIVKCECIELERSKAGKERKERIVEREKLGLGEIILSNENGKLQAQLNLPDDVPIEEEDVFPPFLQGEKLQGITLLKVPSLFFISPLSEILSGISVYDFDPRLPKKAVPITGKAELEEDGSNLALVLNHIIEDKEKKRKFSNLIKDLLPFVADVDIEEFADKSLLFKLREIYHKRPYLPPSLISDGTINITALIIALYFEKKSLIIIEEPERNIHPSLIARVIDMMKDASREKQIIVSTHNPEIVRHTGLENLLLVSRDKHGFSTICRAGEKEEIRTFLSNEMGIEDLYVQNLLGIWT